MEKLLELINTKKINIIDDTYNASYDSIKAALNTLKNRKEKLDKIRRYAT